MYKTIICAIEACDEGQEVLSKAYEFSQMYNAKLFVTHIIPYTLLPNDYQKQLKEEAQPAIEAIVSSLGIPKKDVTIKVGKPYEQICRLAESKNADLIILGTHSKKSIHTLIGSTANGVVNHANCDVSLIKV